MPVVLVRFVLQSSRRAESLQRCFFAGDRWQPGPWNLGPWGKPVGMYACAFAALMLPILCFPAVHGSNLSPQTMNWYVYPQDKLRSSFIGYSGRLSSGEVR